MATHSQYYGNTVLPYQYCMVTQYSCLGYLIDSLDCLCGLDVLSSCLTWRQQRGPRASPGTGHGDGAHQEPLVEVGTGSAPVHGACSLPAHAAQALGCSARNHPRPALGCLHFPGPSRSGPGTQVVLRGADSWLGLRFVPFPDPSSSGDEVFGARDCCDLSPPRRPVI